MIIVRYRQHYKKNPKRTNFRNRRIIFARRFLGGKLFLDVFLKGVMQYSYKLTLSILTRRFL